MEPESSSKAAETADVDLSALCVYPGVEGQHCRGVSQQPGGKHLGGTLGVMTDIFQVFMSDMLCNLCSENQAEV